MHRPLHYSRRPMPSLGEPPPPHPPRPVWKEAELGLLGAGEYVTVHNGGVALGALVAVAVAVQPPLLTLPLTAHQVLVAETRHISHKI